MVQDEVEQKTSDFSEVVEVNDEEGLSEAELEARRERFIEGIDFLETE